MRWTGFLLILLSGCFTPTMEPRDAGPAECVRTIGTPRLACLDGACTGPQLSRAHRRRVWVGDSAYDFGLFNRSTLTSESLSPNFNLGALYGTGTTFAPTTSRDANIVQVWTATPPMGTEYRLLRVEIDPRANSGRIAVFAERDGGSYAAGAWAHRRDGGLALLADWRPSGTRTGESAGRVLLFEEPDAGTRVHEFTRLEPAFTFGSSELFEAEDAFVGRLSVGPSFVSAFVRLRLDGGADAEDFVAPDAGGCVFGNTPARSSDTMAWCEDATGTEVLRYEQVFDRRAPQRVFRHDGGVQVVAVLEARLLVALDVRFTPEAGWIGSLGWLDADGFRLISANRRLPIGYGPWTDETAAFTFSTGDAETSGTFELVEARYDCP